VQALRARAAIGAGVGVGAYAVGLWWATGFNAAGYVGLVGHGALCMAAAAALVPARRRWGIVVGLPAALVLTEWVRGSFPFGGLPIGGLALGQAGGPLVASARLGGVLLVTAITALAGAGIAELVGGLVARRGGSITPRRWVAGLLPLAVVLAVVAAGRLGPDGAGPGPHPKLRVALVQGGGPRGLNSADEDPAVVFERQVAATNAIHQPVDLVLWPEDAVHVDQPVDQTAQGAELSALASRLHATLVAGVVTDVSADHFTNAAIAWSPDGTIVARYDKVHRVPFGEYIPARGLVEHLANLSLVPRDAIAGHGPGILVTPAGPLGVVISYEVFYEGRARDAIRAGGEVLLVPTNASSYATSQIPAQEIAAARLRAWETGRDTLQAAPTGYSALITPNGAVVDRTVLGRQQTVIVTAERRSGRTIFVQLGDQPFLLLAAGILIVARWRWPVRTHT
jgi:apolipoprotein N-acyltransferase